MPIISKNFKWLGIIFIFITGLIHLIDAKPSFEDAAYKGWLFYVNCVSAWVAAYGIVCNKKWGWKLGLLIAVGSFVGYIASRTVGLPMIPAEPDEWLEPLGVAAMTAEGLFIAIFIRIRNNKSFIQRAVHL